MADKFEINGGLSVNGESDLNGQTNTEDLVPSSGGSFSLGTSGQPYKDLFLEGESLHLGEGEVSFKDEKLFVNDESVATETFVTETTEDKVSLTDVPNTSASPGTPGNMSFDDNFLYVKTNKGWGKIALNYSFVNPISATGTWNGGLSGSSWEENNYLTWE